MEKLHFNLILIVNILLNIFSYKVLLLTYEKPVPHITRLNTGMANLTSRDRALCLIHQSLAKWIKTFPLHCFDF